MTTGAPVPVSLGLTLVTAVLACAQTDSWIGESRHHRFRVVTVAGGFEHPWAVAFLPDGRMLVTERPGRLRLVHPDGRVSAPLAGVPPVAASGQGGLLDVALAPDFAMSRLLYLSYAEPAPSGEAGTAVGRGRLGDTGLEGFEVVWRQIPKVSGGAHCGSRLVFSRDGHLFVTTGDRHEQPAVQDLATTIGKVIRIRPDGAIPPDNPFAGRPGARPEIWSSGHRNAQGAAVHPVSGALWTAEHGARGGDEVNRVEAGKNYGWPVITYGRDYSGMRIGEGTSKPGMEQPLYYWDPSVAPSGLTFYTGERFPGWRGSAFVGALAGRRLVRLELDGERVTGEERLLRKLGERIRDVRQGPDGCLYILTDERAGRLLRLEPI